MRNFHSFCDLRTNPLNIDLLISETRMIKLWEVTLSMKNTDESAGD